MKPIIPPRCNRKRPRAFDEDVYAWRKYVEHLINKLKQCRAVATRYCKRARNYLGFVFLSALLINLN